MAFDPEARIVTMLLQQINGSHGTPVFRRFPYNFVTYDGAPTTYLEPRNASDLFGIVTPEATVARITNQAPERIGRIEYYGTRPWEAFSLDDIAADL
jgi:hypothetical protein